MKIEWEAKTKYDKTKPYVCYLRFFDMEFFSPTENSPRVIQELFWNLIKFAW